MSSFSDRKCKAFVVFIDTLLLSTKVLQLGSESSLPE